MHLNSWFRILFDKWTNTTDLGSGKVLIDNPDGRGDDREFFGHLHRRRRVGRHIESSFSIREIKRTRALCDHIPGARLKQSWSAGVILGRTRPEDAKLLLDLFVCDSGVIGNSARDAARNSSKISRGSRNGNCLPPFPVIS